MKPTDFVVINGRRHKVINPTTKKANNLICNYLSWAFQESIFSIYANPSDEKIRAYHSIREECYCAKGFGVRLGSANTYCFSMAYLVNVGRFTYLVYHTPYNTYVTVYPPCLSR